MKLVTRYDAYRSRVKYKPIRIQSAGNTSLDATEGIYHTLVVYGYPNDIVLLSNHGIDAGGGEAR